MDSMLVKQYAKKSTSPGPLGQTWYISHHGIANPSKPDKVWIVFDWNIVTLSKV